MYKMIYYEKKVITIVSAQANTRTPQQNTVFEGSLQEIANEIKSKKLIYSGKIKLPKPAAPPKKRSKKT